MNIAFVPVRGGSKGIHRKNVRNLNGLPLLYYALDSLERSKHIDLIVVATDEYDIATVARDFKSQKMIIYDRDKENAQDQSTTESVMKEYFGKYQYHTNSNIFLIQVTNPFLLTEHVDTAVQLMAHNDSVVSVTRDRRFIWSEQGEPLNYDPLNRPRRQDWNGLLIENGALYGTKLVFFNTLGCRITKSPALLVMEEKYTQIEIDDMEDLLTAEVLLRRNGQRIEQIKKRLRLI